MNRLQLGMEGSLSCMLEVQSGCLKPHGAKAIDMLHMGYLDCVVRHGLISLNA